ncbi:hypothetical protein Pla110_33970 [Polystyrenella longa]|uniref:Uncharacterized protein n=1 Tax=Polystyrenella longa TaxID=2528007 RepID=A0A518CR14_9PLAN|nr:hypothetical protein [Polystyrenella longa]QDU81653.1 hypothetical protein Pla110_33970 [Polystyrenella longa]
MKSAGMLCAGLMLVTMMTGCYHCSYKYNPCTGITEQQCKKVGFWCKKDKPGCGSCSEMVVPECGMPACGMPDMGCSCEAPMSYGCEMPETCGCGIPEVTCSLPETCAYPPTCGCAIPETCGCGYPSSAGYPIYESGPVYSHEYSAPSSAPQMKRQPTPTPAPIKPPEDPSATQTHYTVPQRHYR